MTAGRCRFTPAVRRIPLVGRSAGAPLHDQGAESESEPEMFRARRVMRRRRAVARTAEVGGQDQQPQGADQDPPPVPATDPVAQLEELAELREQGILTEEEFAAEKKKLVGH
jgi:hypothetical protein